MKQVLLVDDDASFLLSLSDGLSRYADQFKVFTAANGKEAIEVLKSQTIDLVITDLKMPVMDGFALLAHMSRNYPSVGVIVMTAFGTTEIEQTVRGLGSSQYLEKPLDLDELTAKIFHELDACERGFIRGFSLPAFLQLVEMEKKGYALRISSKGREGYLFFVDGELVEARTAEGGGLEAALDIAAWDNATIEIKGCSKRKEGTIRKSIGSILIEAFRRKDERRHAEEAAAAQTPASQDEQEDAASFEGAAGDTGDDTTDTETFQQGDDAMAQEIEQIMMKLKDIDGFIGVGAFTAQGELVSSLSSSTAKLEEIGALANDVLLKAQKATDVMGVGRGQMVHIEAPKAHVLARCLNENPDFSSTSVGKAHVHMVLVLDQDANLGLAKLRLSSVIQEVAPHFR